MRSAFVVPQECRCFGGEIMLTVHKHHVELGDYFEIAMPKGAKILTVAEQHGLPCLWALVDTDKPIEKRLFRFAGTGHPITERPEHLQFVATFQMQGGSLVFHIFEVVA